MAVISGIAQWAHVVEPNNKPNKAGIAPSMKYEIVVTNLDEASVEKIKEMNLSKAMGKDRLQNVGDDRGYFIKIKSLKQPDVIDKYKKDIVPMPLIGNGSKVKVQCNSYTAGTGTHISFSVVMVTELVSFTKNLDEFEDEEENDDNHFALVG